MSFNPWAIFALIGVLVLAYKLIVNAGQKHIVDDEIEVNQDPDFLLPLPTQVFKPSESPVYAGHYRTSAYSVKRTYDKHWPLTFWNGKKWYYLTGEECYAQYRYWYGLSEQV